jgi:hypothetical protein
MLGVASGLPMADGEDARLMREAGIGWLRCGKLGLDPEKFLCGEGRTPVLAALKERIGNLRDRGFQIMGITPNPGNMPASAGPPGSSAYHDNYRRMCAFLGEEFHGLIDWWQVANELDIWLFRETLSLDDSVTFLKAGINGLKESDPDLKVGINITLYPSLPGKVDGNTDLHEGVYIAERIYGDAALDLDYAGFDSYPGTWRSGGVDSWVEYLEGFHRLTQKPLLIQEFGYSSAGEMMSAEESASGIFPCQAGKWRFAWRGAHTPEIQAAFLDETIKTFAKIPYLLGATYYRWEDQDRCWQCQKEGCPVETAWGLVDLNGNPKPSYFSLKSAAAKYLSRQTGPIRS